MDVNLSDTGINPSVLIKNCALDPENFINFFDNAVKNDDLSNKYAPHIIEGIARHILYRFCNYPAPEKWNPKTPLPNKSKLLGFIIDCLEKQLFLPEDARPAAMALKSCACIVKSQDEIDLLFSHYLSLASHPDPELKPDLELKLAPELKPELNTGREHTDPEYISQNSVRGNIAEGTMLLAINLLKNNTAFPKLVPVLLVRFATDSHPGVKVSILKYLSDYAQFDPKKAWHLFQAASPCPVPGLWPYGEQFLQSRYDKNFHKVKYYLKQAKHQGIAINYESWGMVIGTRYLSGFFSVKQLLQAALVLNHTDTFYQIINTLITQINNLENLVKPVKALVELFDITLFSKKILTRIKDVLLYLDTDYLDITSQITYKFIINFKGCEKTYDLTWFYNFINSLAEKSPVTAVQLCELLVSKMEESPEHYKIWQGGKHSQTLINIIKKSNYRPQGIISRIVLMQNKT